MTFNNARNTSQDPTSATPAVHRQRQQVLHQHREPVRQHAYIAKQRQDHTHVERIPLGSSLNGLDRVLEPSRRRAFLATAMR